MDVHEAINVRRSVRAYADRPISADLLDRLRAALRSAPSACNIQPWRFIFVQAGELRVRLAAACNGQTWMASAPVTVVGCGLADSAFGSMGGHRHTSVDIDIAIALDHLSLAAASEGLGTCWIGAFDEGQVKQLLHVPGGVRVVALMPVGYPTPPEGNAPLNYARRKPPSEIFSVDGWD